MGEQGHAKLAGQNDVGTEFSYGPAIAQAYVASENFLSKRHIAVLERGMLEHLLLTCEHLLALMVEKHYAALELAAQGIEEVNAVGRKRRMKNKESSHYSNVCCCPDYI